MIRLFSLERIGKTNARFDRKKLLSFNKDGAAVCSEFDLLDAFKDFLRVNEYSDWLIGSDEKLARILDVCKGFRTFPDVINKCAFLFKVDDQIQMDSQAVETVLLKDNRRGYEMLKQILPILESCENWTEVESLENILTQRLSPLGYQINDIAQPIRVAITGTTISPSIGDSLALLGKKSTLNRIRRALTMVP